MIMETQDIQETRDVKSQEPKVYDFGWAIRQLKAGKRVCRRGWNGPQFLELQVPDAGSKMTTPYIYIETTQGDMVPWLASQTDTLGEDWELA